LGMSAYLLPFVFVLNPALLLEGSPLAVVLAIATVLMSGAWIAWGTEGTIGARPIRGATRALLLAGSFVLGSSTIWLGPESPAIFAVLAAGLALTWALRLLHPKAAPGRGTLATNTGNIK